VALRGGAGGGAGGAQASSMRQCECHCDRGSAACCSCGMWGCAPHRCCLAGAHGQALGDEAAAALPTGDSAAACTPPVHYDLLPGCYQAATRQVPPAVGVQAWPLDPGLAARLCCQWLLLYSAIGDPDAPGAELGDARGDVAAQLNVLACSQLQQADQANTTDCSATRRVHVCYCAVMQQQWLL
jgi:hypothetical protein